MPSVNKNSFISFFSSIYLLFHPLVSLHQQELLMQCDKGVVRGYFLALYLILSVKALSFSVKYDVSCRFFVDGLHQVEKFLFIVY